MQGLKSCVLAGVLAVLAAGAPGFASDAAADPLAALTSEVSAVLYADGAPRLLLVDKAGGGGSRTLRVGEEYRDGWRLESATATAAVLRKGAQTREIIFKFESAPQVAAGPSVAGPISTTNALVGGSPRAATPVRSDLDAAQATLEAKYGPNYLDDLTRRTGVSRERILELAARGVPPPPPMPPPPPPPPRPRSPGGF